MYYLRIGYCIFASVSYILNFGMASNFQDMTSSLDQNLDNNRNKMHTLNFYAIKCIIYIWVIGYLEEIHCLGEISHVYSTKDEIYSKYLFISLYTFK